MFRLVGFSFALVLVMFAPVSAGPSDAKLELKNPRFLERGIVTGGQPSKEDLDRLKKQGVKTIINLRQAGEVTKHDNPAIAKRFNYAEEKAVESIGLNYFHIPVSSQSDITVETAKLLDEALKASADGGVLVHCGSGNRAGAIMALRAFHLEGKSADDALAVGKSAGLTKLEPKVRADLGLPPLKD